MFKVAMLALPSLPVPGWGKAAGQARPDKAQSSLEVQLSAMYQNRAEPEAGEMERMAAFLDDLRKTPGSKLRFNVTYVNGARTAVTTRGLKAGEAVARAPRIAVIGAETSEGHRLLAGRCAASGEERCSNTAFAAAALWICAASVNGPKLCHAYAKVMPTARQLRTFASFTLEQRIFTQLLEPSVAEGWVRDFSQLQSLLEESRSELRQLGFWPRAEHKAELASTMWWALGAASTRAMIQPDSFPSVGHVRIALFPGLDLFNFDSNSSAVNAEYRVRSKSMDVVATRAVAKGEQILIPRDAKMVMSALDMLVGQGFVQQGMPQGPELQMESSEVPFSYEKAEHFGCLNVPGHLERLHGSLGTSNQNVIPELTRACMHVMWYPLQEAEQAILVGHLRYPSLTIARGKRARKPSKKQLQRWRKWDVAALGFLKGVCQGGLERVRSAFGSKQGRALERDKVDWVSAALLAIAREFKVSYERCKTELYSDASATQFGERAKEDPKNEL